MTTSAKREQPHPGESAAFFRKTTLPNGLRVVTSEMPHTRSVSISIFIGVGSRYEPSEQAGISHFIEHMVFKGTARRPNPRDISGTIESTGGVLNAGTDHEYTVYWCKVAQPHFRESLDLLFDMLRNSLLEPEGLEKERMVVIEELNMINDYPSYKVDALIDEMLWPNHPLGRDVGGTKESVSAIMRDMMLAHLQRYYNPANIVVSVAGSVAHEEVVEQVEALSGAWPAANNDAWTPFTHTQEKSQFQLEYRKTEQAHLSIAVPAVASEHPSRYAVDLMSVILGEGMSSRLFVEVREAKGLAYDVHSGVTHFQDCGAFVINAGVDPKRVYDAVQTILEQVAIIRDGVPDEELGMAKRLSTGRMLLRMEDTRAVSNWMGNQELLQGRILGMDQVVERINHVTSEQMRDVASRLLTTEKLNMALVGPCRGQRRLERLLR
ncbi:MAG: insulinase family protein, partial [Chloroflexi bacterium]|nr:insulinase family protein [Chloroflexota bacterium]